MPSVSSSTASTSLLCEIKPQGQKDTLIARARTAKTTTQVNDMLGSITGTTSMDAFDRMQEKVETLEASAEVSKIS